MRPNLSYELYIYEFLRRAEALQPHAPARMFSSQSKGPIQFWACDICARYEHTYGANSAAPWCPGGLKFSFETVEADW